MMRHSLRHPYGETRNAEDERRSFVALAIFALSVPSLANGFYNPVLAQSAVLYWTAEFFTWIAWPTVWFLVLYRRGLTLADLGLTLPSPIYRGLLPFMGVTLLLFPLSFVFYGLIGYVAQIMISDNWLDQGFRYPSQIPADGTWRVIGAIYLAATAGVVEEIVFRALPRLLADNSWISSFFYVLSSSVLFACVHWENGQIALVETFFWGMSMAGLFLATRSLWPGIIIHFLTDFVIFYYDFSLLGWLMKAL